MSCEAGGTSEVPEKPRVEVDVHRAIRELERWLRIDLDAPRPDQKGYDSPREPNPVNHNWRDGAELVMTSVTNRETGETVWYRPDGTVINFP
ncbi:MAG: hypothetical protein G01um10145_746 [Microgenomates group bacterium Gr01-1014_5]|nr:MAG: hypothetical protein G01um10145_746 [Microgenomates group bacterium Gr01-1014_5]